jgi:RNA polymerase sigma-70 factor (ECF subfamily)
MPDRKSLVISTCNHGSELKKRCFAKKIGEFHRAENIVTEEHTDFTLAKPHPRQANMVEDRNQVGSSVTSPAEAIDRTAEFLALFSANARRIYAYIVTLLPQRADAEEVFQEACTVLWERFHEFERGTSFGAWGCRIAYFKALQVKKRRRLQPIAFSDATWEVLDRDVIVMDHALEAEYRALADCVAKLNEPDRQMILVRYRKGGNPQRLAEDLGRPVRSIYKSLERIRRTLFQCITRTLALEERR